MTVLKFESERTTEDDNPNLVGYESESLANGDNLSREDFLRIWEQLPNLKHAELIEGIVYGIVNMASPLSRKHGSTALDLSAWISLYRCATPGSEGGAKGTWLMLNSAPQPDVALRRLPEYGGQSQDEGLYPAGAPELAIEVAYSTAAYDLHQKLKLYHEAGVSEYLVVVLRKPEIRWHRLIENRYQQMEPDADGVFRSMVFPGLWLNGPALLRDDMNAVIATLQEGLRSKEHAEFMSKLQSKRGS